MFNILLDELPEKWNGYEVYTDLSTGIQLSQCLIDNDLSDREKLYLTIHLLFVNDFPRDCGQIFEAVTWLLNGWNNDCMPTQKDNKVDVMDFDMDSWRIYAAFRGQYGINLSQENLHFWEFMGLLSNLDECAFVKVVEIRQKEITANMSKKEKDEILKAKAMYLINKEKNAKDTGADQEARDYAIKEFNRLRRKT
mgnify:CR=1 FL=1